MTPLHTALSPLFLLLVFPVLASVVPAINYPGQKFLLQKKFPDGTIRKVKTYTHIVSREQVESEHGPGHYSLKSMLPRITLIWKDPPKPSDDGNDPPKPSNDGDGTVETQALRLEPLERKTKYLTLGLVGLGIGTAAGLGANTVGLLDHTQRLNRADSILEAMQGVNLIPPFYCAYCSQRLSSPIDKYCGQCGKKNLWPDGRLTGEISEKHCAYCPVSS